MREPGNYWVKIKGHWTHAHFDRYGWYQDGRPVSVEAVGHYVGSE